MISFKEWSLLKETSALARKVYVNGREYTIEDKTNGYYIISNSDKNRWGTLVNGNAVGAGSTMTYQELSDVVDADIQQKSENERQNNINNKNNMLKRW